MRTYRFGLLDMLYPENNRHDYIESLPYRMPYASCLLLGLTCSVQDGSWSSHRRKKKEPAAKDCRWFFLSCVGNTHMICSNQRSLDFGDLLLSCSDSPSVQRAGLEHSVSLFDTHTVVLELEICHWFKDTVHSERKTKLELITKWYHRSGNHRDTRLSKTRWVNQGLHKSLRVLVPPVPS